MAAASHVSLLAKLLACTLLATAQASLQNPRPLLTSFCSSPLHPQYLAPPKTSLVCARSIRSSDVGQNGPDWRFSGRAFTAHQLTTADHGRRTVAARGPLGLRMIFRNGAPWRGTASEAPAWGEEQKCTVCEKAVCQCPSELDLQQWAGSGEVYYSDWPVEGADVQVHGLGLAPVQTFFPQASRVIAIGDIHGDEGALNAVLRMASCVDADGNWCGGTTHVVQIGDILDRGDEERGCLERLMALKQQAAAGGGAVHVLLGNHEAMNVDRDFAYVGLGGYEGWESLEAKPSSLLGNMAALAKGLVPDGVPRLLRDRAKAFTVGTGFAALMLSEMPLVIQLGDTVCVHGGLAPKHLELGLHNLNVEVSEWLRGVAPRPETLDEDDAMIWNRAFSAPADRPLKEVNARRLENVLWNLGARRMIVGHTPQAGGINCFTTRNGYEVWRTDTGMSRWVKNGPLECLELLPDGSAQVLTKTGTVPGVVRKMDEGMQPMVQKRANSGAGRRGYAEGPVPG